MNDSNNCTRSLFVLFFAFAFSPFLLQAQSFGTPTGSTPTTTTASPKKYDLEKMKGTYQIQVINFRGNPTIPDDLAKQIAEGRMQDQTNNIMLGTHVRLMIPSQNAIDDPNFEPIAQEVIWLTE